MQRGGPMPVNVWTAVVKRETTARVASGEYRSAVNLQSPIDNSGPSV